MALQQYHLQVKYRKGTQNQNADALSRLPLPNRQDDTVNAVHFDRNHLIDEQRRDTFLGPIYALLAGPLAPPTRKTAKIIPLANQYVLDNNILKCLDKTGEPPLIAIPSSLGARGGGGRRGA